MLIYVIFFLRESTAGRSLAYYAATVYGTTVPYVGYRYHSTKLCVSEGCFFATSSGGSAYHPVCVSEGCFFATCSVVP